MSENLRVYLAQLNATAGDVEGNSRERYREGGHRQEQTAPAQARGQQP